MGSYTVERVPEQRFGRLYLSTVGLLLAALVAVSIPAFSFIDVSVDGQRAKLPAGSTAGDVASLRLMGSSAGDLVDREGAVIARGRGEPPRLVRVGHQAAGNAATLVMRELDADTELMQGDQLRSVRGADVRETEVPQRVAIPVDVQYTGKGPLMALEHPGSPGVREQVVGAASGKVFEDAVLEEPTPMVVRRYFPNGERKVVALTFDDGPWPGHTEAILDVLKAEGVQATFFMIGRQVYRYPDVVARIRDEGHTLGNHTEDHVILGRATPEEVRRQVTEGQRAIQSVAGVKPGWFRPPGGSMSARVGHEVARFEMQVAMWSVDPQDWRKPPVATMIQRVLTNVKPGAVVLLHDGGGDRTNTVAAVGPIVRELKKRGYTFVTLDELHE